MSVSSRDPVRDAHAAAVHVLVASESSGVPIPSALDVAAHLRRWAYRVVDDAGVRNYTVADVRAACALRGLPLADSDPAKGTR